MTDRMKLIGIEEHYLTAEVRPAGEARRFLAACGLSDGDKAGFAHGSWERLIRRS